MGLVIAVYGSNVPYNETVDFPRHPLIELPLVLISIITCVISFNAWTKLDGISNHTRNKFQRSPTGLASGVMVLLLFTFFLHVLGLLFKITLDEQAGTIYYPKLLIFEGGAMLVFAIIDEMTIRWTQLMSDDDTK